MGRWGDGIFQSDQILDLASDLSTEVGVELYMVGVPEEEWREMEMDAPSLSTEKTREYLDDGAFQRVFESYKGKRHNHYTLVIFTALCMQVGAYITPGQINYLKRIYKRCGLIDGSNGQFKDALDNYENGTPWIFDSPGLLETVNMQFAHEEQDKEVRATEPTTKKSIDEPGLTTRPESKVHTQDKQPTPTPSTVINALARDSALASATKVQKWLAADDEAKSDTPNAKRLKTIHVEEQE